MNFTADFETTTDIDDCRVWAYAICEIGDTNNFIYGNSIEGFIDFTKEKQNGFFLAIDILCQNDLISENILLKAENEKPFVIPELREWSGATGVFTITGDTKIVYPKNQAELAAVAEQLAADYKKMTGTTLQTLAGKPSNGDIALCIKRNKELNDEGYTINIDNKVEITSNTSRGAMWATRTLLQIAEQNSGKLPKGTIVDYPDYEMRSFMLDCGRKFIPISFLHEYVDFMAYYKMNTFHIHLNDNAFKQFFLGYSSQRGNNLY